MVNLSVVALFGLLMRSKIVFSLPFLDYRNLLSAHSHFAFAGWVGLSLIAFLIFDFLPAHKAQNKTYRAILWGIQISSVGMALSFPFVGYTAVSIFFSSLYILVTYWFGIAFLKDIRKQTGLDSTVRLLAGGAVWALLLSAIGPAALSCILMTKSGNSLLYRDSIYTFLHLQYNGFFTLAVFALLFGRWQRKTGKLPPPAKQFGFCLTVSILPALFLALLWHNLVLFYVLAAAGCVLILASVFFFLPLLRLLVKTDGLGFAAARQLRVVCLLSFVVKMLLTIGTIYPPLGHAVYGARPVIIGFLHLVFLAFVSFYLLGAALEEGLLPGATRLRLLPLYAFAAGVLLNEAFLMIQGLEILFSNNNTLYNWLLWGAAILLFAGACGIAMSFYRRRERP